MELDELIKKAVLTEWFINPTYGQPRYVDIYRLRAFARSEWVAAVTSYLINRIKEIPIEITAKNPNKREKPSLRIQYEIKKGQDLFDNCTPSGQDFKNGVETAFLKDLLELDAGVISKIFSQDSYNGNPKDKDSLKPLGERTLGQFMAIDGGSVLADVTPHNEVLGWYQYSYVKPTDKPVWFDRNELCYSMRYPRSYSPYGWAATQNADAILGSLVNSATWNSNFFSQQGIPRGMISLMNADDKDVKKFQAYWRQKIKGQWYEVPVLNKEAKWVPFSMNAKDMEWLNGQKWYQRMICALFQVSPGEIALDDTSRIAGVAAATTDRIQKKSSITPLLLLIENVLNRGILSEISPRIVARYVPEDPEELRVKTENENRMVELGLKTINDIRADRGDPPYAWGDLPPSILNNLIRSYSKLGVMPTIEEMNSLNFSNVEIPKQKPQVEDEFSEDGEE